MVMVSTTSFAWAGGRCCYSHCYSHYRHCHCRGSEFNQSFNRAFGTTLGVAGGIVAAQTAVTVLNNVFGQPQTVVVQSRGYYRPRSMYDRAYEEEIERLRWREFQRQQYLERRRGIQDAYRDFYGR